MPPALLVHAVLLKLTPPKTLEFAMLKVWLPRTQWLVKGWAHDPVRVQEMEPWGFCWDFWDKQALLFTGEDIWTGIHVTSRRREPTTRSRAKGYRQRIQVLVEKEKLGIGDIILALLQIGAEVILLRLCNYSTGASYIPLVLEPLRWACSCNAKIQTNAEFT